MRYSCASLRADSLTQAVVDGLADSGQRQLPLLQKRAVNGYAALLIKGLAKSISKMPPLYPAKSGIQHMRLYIMIGLPTETDEDIEAIVGLAERTQASYGRSWL